MRVTSVLAVAALGLPLVVAVVMGGCASGSAERRPQAAAPEQSSADQSIQLDRIDEINRLCQRKAGIAVPRCWNDEYLRTGKKFEAQVTLMIVVNAAGTAEDVKVIGSTAKSKELEACLMDQARTWSYPEGKVSVPVNCSFFLRSSM